jgi:hypothetical protein
VHDGNTAAQLLDLPQIVRRYNNRRMPKRNNLLLQKSNQAGRRDRVQTFCWFIHKKDSRLMQKSPENGKALADTS